MGLNVKISDTNVRIGPVRFSYVNVFRKNPQSDKYSVAVLIPKTEHEAIETLKSAIENAKTLGKTKCFGGKVPANLKTPLHDGDVEKDDEAYKGCYYFNATNTNRPGVRVKTDDGAIVEALDDEDFYSGCYGAITVNLFPYAKNGNSGVSASLQNVIKLNDGEKLSGGRSADLDFADL